MYRLGIDLGGTNIVAGVVDENYKIISTAKRKTNCPRPSKEIIDDIAKAAVEAIENAGITINDIEVAGIGAPGDIDIKNGIILLANNLNFKNIPIVDMLQERIGIKFYIQNDANAAANTARIFPCRSSRAYTRPETRPQAVPFARTVRIVPGTSMARNAAASPDSSTATAQRGKKSDSE